MQGLSVFRKLREYRRLHETAYPLSVVTQTEGVHKGQLLPKKKKGHVLMDQKANSVADMAAVMLQTAKPPTKEELRVAEWKTRTDGRPLAKKGKGKQRTADALTIRGSVDGVRIRWANILDAEYAETWPSEVVHEGLEAHRYTAAWPPAPPLVPAEQILADSVMEEEEAVDAGTTGGGVANSGEATTTVRRASEVIPVGVMPDTSRPNVVTA